MATINGNDSPNALVGTDLGDRINALGGNDSINGELGNDSLIDGVGNDL